MLNRFAQVSADGAYNKPPHDKLSYGGMIFIRANMVRYAPLHCVAVADETKRAQIGQCGWTLAKAATISSRYCTVRRQFADPEAGAEAEDQEREGGANGATNAKAQLEKQVIYYPSVYHRVLPVVARAWVFVTIGKDMVRSSSPLPSADVLTRSRRSTSSPRWPPNSPAATPSYWPRPTPSLPA